MPASAYTRLEGSVEKERERVKVMLLLMMARDLYLIKDVFTAAAAATKLLSLTRSTVYQEEHIIPEMAFQQNSKLRQFVVLAA